MEQKLKTLRYYDSLSVESETCRLFGDFLVTELKKKVEDLQWLPPSCPSRCNTVKQGPLECGFYVCWWCEEEARER